MARRSSGRFPAAPLPLRCRQLMPCRCLWIFRGTMRFTRAAMLVCPLCSGVGVRWKIGSWCKIERRKGTIRWVMITLVVSYDLNFHVPSFTCFPSHGRTKHRM